MKISRRTTLLVPIGLIGLVVLIGCRTIPVCHLPPIQPLATAFNIRDFGAIGYGTNKDTVAFQKALDACAVSSGGEVIVPAGNYLIGSVQIGTRTILRLESDSV